MTQHSFPMAETAAPRAVKRKASGNLSQPETRTPRFKLMDRTVTLVAKPSGTRFDMHRGLLCSVSTYFKTVLHSEFQEAAENVIYLEETSKETLERFQLWLYDGTLLDAGENVKAMRIRHFGDLYIFGDSRGIPQLQNLVVDTLIRRCQNQVFPMSATVRSIYDQLPP